MLNRIEELCHDIAAVDGCIGSEEQAEINKLLTFYRRELQSERKDLFVSDSTAKHEQQDPSAAQGAIPFECPEQTARTGLDDALTELNALIGLLAVKRKVMSLTNRDEGAPSPSGEGPTRPGDFASLSLYGKPRNWQDYGSPVARPNLPFSRRAEHGGARGRG
jgi:hypothetical protein